MSTGTMSSPSASSASACRARPLSSNITMRSLPLSAIQTSPLGLTPIPSGLRSWPSLSPIMPSEVTRVPELSNTATWWLPLSTTYVCPSLPIATSDGISNMSSSAVWFGRPMGMSAARATVVNSMLTDTRSRMIRLFLMARLADIVCPQPVFVLLGSRTALEFVRVVARGAIDLAVVWAQRQLHARGRLPSLHLSQYLCRRLREMHPPFRLRAEGHTSRVRPQVVAAPAHVIEVLPHVEGHIDRTIRSGLRNPLVAKKAGRSWRILDRALVGVQRRVLLPVVALEALVSRIVRHPVAEKTGGSAGCRRCSGCCTGT